MNRAFSRRDYAVSKARSFANVSNWKAMVHWLKRAQKFQPVTEMQMWRIRNIVGPYKFEELNLRKFSKGGFNA